MWIRDSLMQQQYHLVGRWVFQRFGERVHEIVPVLGIGVAIGPQYKDRR